MALIREDVRQEDWEFFDALNIKFIGKHITANEYSSWVIDKEREIIFTQVGLIGRDHGETYILIWGKARVYIYVESRSVKHTDGTRELRWYIENITVPISLKNKQDELLNLIRELADVNFIYKSTANFVVYKIAEPKFVEGE